MIQFPCRSCRTLHAAAPSQAGTVLECYLCGQKMRVPGGEQALSDTKVNREKTVVDSKNSGKEARKPPAPAVSTPRLRCPECDIPLKVNEGYGKNVQCPLCTAWFRVPAARK